MGKIAVVGMCSFSLAQVQIPGFHAEDIPGILVGS